MTPKVIWKEYHLRKWTFRELNHGDSIKIPLFSPITKKTLTVTLDGAVKKPGKYSFVEGTTLHQIIAEAGDTLTMHTLMELHYLERKLQNSARSI